MALLLFCLFIGLCLFAVLRNFTFLSSYNIFTGIFCLYYTLGLGDYFTPATAAKYISEFGVARFTNDQLVLELILLNTFMAGMLLARGAIKVKQNYKDQATLAFTPPPYKNVIAVSFCLMLAGVLMYAAFIHLAYGGFMDMMRIDRFALYQKKRGMGSLLAGLYIFFTGALIRLFYYAMYRKTISQKFPVITILLTILIFLIQYKNGDRSNMLFLLLPLCLLFLYKKPKFNLYFLLLMPVLLAIMQLLSVQRVAQRMHQPLVHYILHNKQTMGILQNGEYQAPSFVDKVVCEHMTPAQMRYGGTYADALVSMPPVWLSHQRPVLPAEWYARTFFYSDFVKGQGFGFSVIAESVLNFYYAGPMIMGFLLGLLFLYLDKRLKKASFYYFVVYCILQYYIFLIPRSGVAGLLKPVLIVIAARALCTAAVSYFYKWRSENSTK